MFINFPTIMSKTFDCLVDLITSEKQKMRLLRNREVYFLILLARVLTIYI